MTFANDLLVESTNIRVGLDREEGLGYVEAHHQCDPSAIRLAWAMLDALDYEPIPEGEIEPEETEPGWTKIYAYLKEV